MRTKDRTPAALLGAVFCIATAGLVYELVAGTAATYLLGDSVTQFSFVIGLYLFAMGVGSYLSRFIDDQLLTWFIRLELLVGLLGGFAATLLFIAFARDGSFRVVLYLIVGAVGMGVGLEIPLLIRILEERMELKELIAKVLFFDYLGALAASLMFPLFLVPQLGLIKSSLVLGILNAVVGVWVAWLFRARIARAGRLAAEGCLVLAILLFGLWHGEALTHFSEDDLYPDNIIHASSSLYQRIVVTRKSGSNHRLYLNGHLQFDGADEYRYHEALVHPAMSLAPDAPINALVLGGGDGMAVRELLRYEAVKSITLVDLDQAITDLFSDHSELALLNENALKDPRVSIVNSDALAWLDSHKDRFFGVVIIDFPDPGSYSLGKLYTHTFYRMVGAHLTPGGIMAIQSTSPLVARRSFWCIDRTIRSAGLNTQPYHVFVPSFGEWGFILASREQVPVPDRLRRPTPKNLRFLSDSTLTALFSFPQDMAPDVETPINRLNNQILVRLYDEEWNQIN